MLFFSIIYIYIYIYIRKRWNSLLYSKIFHSSVCVCVLKGSPSIYKHFIYGNIYKKVDYIAFFFFFNFIFQNVFFLMVWWNNLVLAFGIIVYYYTDLMSWFGRFVFFVFFCWIYENLLCFCWLVLFDEA